MRITDRARRVLQLASEQARSDGRNLRWKYILLALLEEGSGVGCAALRKLAIDIPSVHRVLRRELDHEHQEDEIAPTSRADEAESLLKRAREHARALGHDYVGTEHLLISLADDLDQWSSALGPVRISREQLWEAIIDVVATDTSVTVADIEKPQTENLQILVNHYTAIMHAWQIQYRESLQARRYHEASVARHEIETLKDQLRRLLQTGSSDQPPRPEV